MQGTLSQINFTDLLLLATGGKKSGVLKLNRGKEVVEIFFTSGNIVHANCPIGEGEKALLYPVTWDEGTFSLLADGTAPRTTISKSPTDILDEVKNMTREWEVILEVIPSAKAVFRLAELSDDNTGPVTVPNVGWRVLSKLDGIRSVQDVAELLRIPFAYAAKVIYSLHKAGLVALTPAAKPAAELVPAALLSRVTTILTDMIGPMAPLVLRDQNESLGESANSLHESKLDELITLIGREISDGKLKSRFEESMVQEIANFKRF
jgi:uncharacterized protein (UPF0147 family)